VLVQLRLKPYRDSVGKLTIGVGRNLDDVGISAEEADVLLANDIAKAQAELKQALPWTANRRDIPMPPTISTYGLSVITPPVGFVTCS